jgi:hypothetical protein
MKCRLVCHEEKGRSGISDRSCLHFLVYTLRPAAQVNIWDGGKGRNRYSALFHLRKFLFEKSETEKSPVVN